MDRVDGRLGAALVRLDLAELGRRRGHGAEARSQAGQTRDTLAALGIPRLAARRQADRRL